MSGFLSYRYREIEPYTAGEQPQDRQYIKLNTNESPFPPSPKAVEAVTKAAVEGLKLYSDPVSRKLRKAIAAFWGLDESEVVATNGSDEALALAFIAYCGGGEGIASPDISYGFYPVLCGLLGLDNEVIPLKEDFTIDVDAFCATKNHVVLANPNAPTGLALSLAQMERILVANPDRIVIVDEAYIDYGGQSCIPLIPKYNNLIVVQTFSKSRSLAGARIGFAAGQKTLMEDLDKIRDSLNPYNINTLSERIGVAAVEDKNYLEACVAEIVKTRAYTANALQKLGFEVLPSIANFLFARHPKLTGKQYYLALKKEGVLVRHFDKDRIRDFARISIGSREEMEILLEKTEKILKGEIAL